MRDFTLPDFPSARTMLYLGQKEIGDRATGLLGRDDDQQWANDHESDDSAEEHPMIRAIGRGAVALVLQERHAGNDSEDDPDDLQAEALKAEIHRVTNSLTSATARFATHSLEVRLRGLRSACRPPLAFRAHVTGPPSPAAVGPRELAFACSIAS